jgi:hypothetical protein
MSIKTSARNLSRLLYHYSRPRLLPRRYGSTLPPRAAFTRPNVDHLKALRSLLSSPSSLLSTIDDTASVADLQPFNDDWMNKYHGQSPIVVKPRSTEEVAKVVKYCNDNGIAIVPQGGNTGLVGECVRRYPAHF